MTTSPVLQNRPTQLPMRVHVIARIEETKRHEGVFYTMCFCPASDEFSKPDFIEIRSKTRLGDNLEVVKVDCILGGYPHQFLVTDKDTGQTRKSKKAVMFLTLIED